MGSPSEFVIDNEYLRKSFIFLQTKVCLHTICEGLSSLRDIDYYHIIIEPFYQTEVGDYSQV